MAVNWGVLLIHQLARPLSLAFTIFLLAGCGGGNSKESITKPKPPLKLKTVTLAMAWDANSNWPVSVELVRVRDASLVDELLGIKPEEWFKKKGEGFRQANPDAYFDAWEVVPGTIVGPRKAKVKARVAGVLFCGLADSVAPFRVKKNGKILVVIRKKGCSIEQDNPKNRSRQSTKSKQSSH